MAEHALYRWERHRGRSLQNHRSKRGTYFWPILSGTRGLSFTTLFQGLGVQRIAFAVDGLDDGTVCHWRVRLLYHQATTPLQQYSRWLTMPWNGWQEADLRTRCPLMYDLNGDCFVNFLDFALLASEWLK